MLSYKKKFFPECYRGEKQILEFFLDVILPKKSFLDVILEPQGASRQPEGVARQRTGEQVGRDDDDDDGGGGDGNGEGGADDDGDDDDAVFDSDHIRSPQGQCSLQGNLFGSLSRKKTLNDPHNHHHYHHK